MLSYETLDTIADSINPGLLVVCLLVIGKAAVARRWRLVGMQVLSILVGLLVVYGMMMADNKLKIWPAFGLDYSTHTAAAILLVAFLSIYAKRLMPAWIAILMAYLVLMRYQEYHSLADIISTALVVTLPIVWAMWRLRSRVAST